MEKTSPGNYKIVTNIFLSERELRFESGTTLNQVYIAYETYGNLNAQKSNAILVCHALSGDAHAGNGGWWDGLIGPGKALDTSKYFIVCSNTIGSCKGSSGPQSVNPETGKPYALTFPVLTIGDMVQAQHMLADFLGISQWHMVIGGSMGGMQAMEWAIMFPERVKSCVVIATAARLSPQALAFGAVGRQAILADPKWNKGNYDPLQQPENGLSIARMIGHITYLSEESMRMKFGRKLQEKNDYGYDFSTDFQIESYLLHQGDKFVNRFDANAYLYLSKAMSYFDLEKKYGSIEEAFANVKSSFLVVSISSDMLYSSAQSKEITHALMKHKKPVTYVEMESPYGHDSFLIETEKLTALVKPYLESLE